MNSLNLDTPCMRDNREAYAKQRKAKTERLNRRLFFILLPTAILATAYWIAEALRE